MRCMRLCETHHVNALNRVEGLIRKYRYKATVSLPLRCRAEFPMHMQVDALHRKIYAGNGKNQKSEQLLFSITLVAKLR